MAKENQKMNANKVGLILGVFFAIMHLIWSILVFLGIAQAYLDWVTNLHFVNLTARILPFNIVNALILIVVAFAVGYVVGWLYSWIYNKIN